MPSGRESVHAEQTEVTCRAIGSSGVGRNWSTRPCWANENVRESTRRIFSIHEYPITLLAIFFFLIHMHLYNTCIIFFDQNNGYLA